MRFIVLSLALCASPAGASEEIADPERVRGAIDEARVRIQSRSEEPKKVVEDVLSKLETEIDKTTFMDVMKHALKKVAERSGQDVVPKKDGPPPVGGRILQGINDVLKGDHPKDPDVFAGSGEDGYRMGDFARAYEDYRRAIELGAADAKVYLGYGSAALRLGDYEEAVKAARAVLASDDKNRRAIALYHMSKDRVSAVRLPSALGESSGGGAPAGPVPPAEAAAAPSPAASPAAAPVSAPERAPAIASASGGALAAASAAAARSAQFTRDAVGALKIRDYPAAYSLANQAVALNPSNAQALNFRAMTLSRMQRYPESVQDASAALALAPGSAAALQTRSWAFAKQGKYEEALIDAQATLEHDPDNAFAYQNLAFARAGLGDRPGALDALRRSAELDSRFGAVLERAVQLPQDQDLTLLFDDAPAPSEPASAPRGSRPGRFLRLAALSGAGGLLIALGVLHIVSARWRDRMRMTVRRVFGATSAPGAAAPAEAAPTGAFWTQYEVVKEIGLGGMGVVYEAIDRSLERRVAVKKMRDEIRLDPGDRRRFVNEARVVAQLHHPNIVDIYGIVEDGGDVYLVFEFVDGRTLQDALKSGGPMDLQRARRVLKEMADAVSHAHERGVIHRDLKPSNVMLTGEGRVKVMDFGIARQAKDAMTRRSMTNTIAGTPPYMAPEQEQGTVRKEADVYALGVCLYEMLTGRLPFAGSGAAMLLDKLNGKHVPPSRRTPSLPPALDEVVARALAPDPDKRYRTPGDFISALDAVQAARAS